MCTNKLAVVTGGNKGIGYSIVSRLCAENGITVYLTARDPQRGAQAVQQLKLEGASPLFHQLDVECEDSISAFANHIKRTNGGIDILVNNAGIAFFTNPSAPLNVQAEKTLATNYFGVVNVCKHLFPLLRKNARVVNISSELGHLSKLKCKDLREKLSSATITEHQVTTVMNEYVNSTRCSEEQTERYPSAYAMSKIGVTCLSKLHARMFVETRRNDNIVVNAVTPGYVKSDMTGGKGRYTTHEGSFAPVYACLLPVGTHITGQYIWNDTSILDWTNAKEIRDKLKSL